MGSRFVLFPTGPGPMTMTIAVANAFYDSSAFFWITEQVTSWNSDIRMKKVNFFKKNCMFLIFLPFFALQREGA